jgi:hypothetical protein
MGWMPNFSYRKNSDTDSFKFIKKKKLSCGPLGKRLDNEIKSLVTVKRKGL